jgi:hypothetical protein
LTEIRGYTLAQLRAFTVASDRARKRRLVDEVMNLRAAQYDKNPFSKYLKGLSD